MDDKQLESRSLQQELTRWIFIVTASVCALGGLTSGLLAYFEAREVQDEVLLQVAQLVSNTETNSFKNPNYYQQDSAIIVFSLNSLKDKSTKLSSYSDGFATAKLKGDSWRVLITTQNDGKRIVVGQQTELRNEIAFANAMSAIVPICILAILLLGLLRWLISTRMKSITNLSRVVDKQVATNLNALSTKSIPTEVVPFIEAINRLLLRTKDSIAQQNRFIADASHELRTPIAALSLLTENLENAQSQPDRQQQMNLMRRGLDRLSNLVNQLLNMARLQNKEADIAKVVRLDEIVKEVTIMFHPLAEQKNIDLGITQITEVSVHNVNNGLLQLVENAMANAIHYTPKGGQIDISVQIIGETATLKVSDTGPGIDEVEIEKVLTPFYRSKNNNVSGTGLGLAICAEIAKQNYGTIELKNKNTGGLDFTYSQPVAVQ